VFVATGERLFRDHRGEAGFDFAAVVTNLAKAVEVQANALLRRATSKLSDTARRANVEGTTVDLAACRPLSLGQLSRVLGGEHDLREGLGRVLDDARWIRETFPPVLAALAEVRNDASHVTAIDRETATHWRNRLVGVGCEGELVALARTRVR
jgi:hypothetical protein